MGIEIQKRVNPDCRIDLFLLVYNLYITAIIAVSKAHIYSRYTHPSNSTFLIVVVTFGVPDSFIITITILKNVEILVSVIKKPKIELFIFIEYMKQLQTAFRPPRSFKLCCWLILCGYYMPILCWIQNLLADNYSKTQG